MDNSFVITILCGFAMSIIIAPICIPFLRKIKAGQTVRDDGPKTHLAKAGTTTMGGVIFLLPLIIVSLFYVKDYPNIIPILILTVGFGVIGFIDDFIKIVLKRSKGLSAVQKLIGQIIVTGMFAYWMLEQTSISLSMTVPFTNGFQLDFGFFNIPLMFIVVLATTNGANFTDGVDGLASSVTVAIAAFFAIVSMQLGSGAEPIIGVLIGGLLGFLLFNVYPAKIFMGDTGSLALGGFVAATAYVLQMPLFILLIAVVYTVELLSVVIQVSYFKITKGKRIFKMAPIHHHFELCGWSETRIVAVFTIVTVIVGIILLGTM